MTLRPARQRRREAGVTLVEVLVVLVIIGLGAAAIGLSLGSGGRTAAIDREIRLLEARFALATDRALIAGAPGAFSWSETGYRFLERDGAEWDPHPVGTLGAQHTLARGVTLRGPAGERAHVITPDLLAPSGPWGIEIGDGSTRRLLVFDGLTLQEVEA
ncbi:MAG: prepilin-type N-terminal cleavage/methylation domain-containing protein [Shimia sp.]